MKWQSCLKRWIAAGVAGVMMGVIGGFLPGLVPEVGAPMTAEAAASDYTADEAIEWVKSLNGKTVEEDGSAPGTDTYAQCVDLIFAYYKHLVGYRVPGNGFDFASNALPDGWTRTKGGTPQKGDILVYALNSDNHVAIYESDSVTWHQNMDGHSKVEPIYSSYWHWNKPTYWGCIHPNFKDPTPKWYEAYDKTDLGKEFYAKIINPSSKLCLSYDGTNAVVSEQHDSEDQIWRFVRQSDGGYSILNKKTDLSLDISNYGTANGTNVQLIGFSGNTAQHFYIYQTKGGFLFRPACSDLVFDMEGYNSKSATQMSSYNLATYPLDDYFDNKTFSIVKWYPDYPLADLGDDFDAQIENPSSNYYITADQTNVVAQKEKSDDTQIWHFNRNADGSYKITSKFNNYSLDISNYGTKNGTNVQLIGYSGNNAQKFFIYSVDGKYLFRPACSDLVFDMENYNSKADTFADSYNIATYPLDDYFDNKLYAVHKITDSDPGDLNADGKTDVTDLILLQKWILKVPKASLKDTNAADMNQDGIIDIFDLALLKHRLLAK